MTEQQVRRRSDVRVPLQRAAPPEERAPGIARQRRCRRLALLVPLGLGSLAVCAAVAAGIGMLGTQSARTSHAFTLAPAAAGMTRDPAQDTAYADQVAGVQDSFRQQFRGRLSQFVTAVYDNPRATPGRPAGSVVFVGAAIDSGGRPEDFVSAVAAQARTAGARVSRVDVGAGALGVCTRTPTTPAITSCAWSTGDSIGQLVPTVDGWDAARLGAAMAELRGAVETTR